MKEFDENTILETPHLILRFLQKEDRRDLFANISHDPEVLTYFVDQYLENEEDFDLEKRIESAIKAKRYFFSIVLKETGEVIGEILQCSMMSEIEQTVELGYALGKKYWNHGYASEALQAMIGLMFASGVHKVTACHLAGNEASGKVMRKCGMVFEGIRKDAVFYHDRYWDTYHYYILKK